MIETNKLIAKIVIIVAQYDKSYEKNGKIRRIILNT